jgi:hypothetical protein
MAKKSYLRKRGPKAGWDIQSWLVDYLNTDVDIYDFEWTIRKFLADQEIRNFLASKHQEIDSDAECVEDLTEHQQVEFKRWLLLRVSDLCRNQESDCPSYLMFLRAAALSKGSWLAHFSKKYFSQFELGSTYERLHLSTWFKEKSIVGSKNLSDEIGVAEIVFGFAFNVDLWEQIIWHGHRYGKYVKLFQCDMAVEAYHIGDNSKQVIFPLGSEYNVIDLSEVYSNGAVDIELKDTRLITVDSKTEVIELAKQGQIEVSNYT